MSQRLNFPIVLRVQGWLLFIEALFMLIPAGVSWFYGEMSTLLAFVASIIITAGVGIVMAKGLNPGPRAVMRRREGLLLTAIIWVFFSLFGMLPFLISGTLTSVTDAFFETMSGFTTTGASVVPDIEVLPRGILFWRALMQWVGGLGIILFTLAVIPMLNQKDGIAMFNAEVTGITHERLRPRVSQTAKDLWLIYIVLTIVMAALLSRSLGWYDAVFHAMTTMATGGFSTKNAGLHYWNDYYVYAVVTVFMFISGINFTIIYSVVRGKFRHLRGNDTFKYYVVILLVVSVVIFANMSAQGYASSTVDRVVFALFDTVSAMTSTGLATVDYETRGEFIAMLLLVVMFFGGMAGSTSGGAKIDRSIVLLKNTANEFYRVLHPNTVTAVRVNGRVLSHTLVAKVIAFLAIYVMVMLVVALVLTLFELPIVDSLYTSLAMISNYGLGYGYTAVADGFASLPAAVKWILSAEMLIGRLELFTVLVLFTPAFWRRD